ncbi:serine protease [Marinobacter sp. BW6]|uniref:S1 family peptidase n=1 Tax=Marinobacter sp. BW6 TaxID=2592624 RepID=UPI0011DEEE20|nr:trypsin-like peptidase domain-containing protein [Marinobacter sp. BW6]TYC57610.1 serine protease [Marinobacter sp. BW6]
MLSLAEELLHTTVRLEGKKANGTSVGTGFFFFRDERLWLVTNKHVVEGVLAGRFFVLKGIGGGEDKQPLLGEFHEVSFSASNFIGHPDPTVDVTVMNVSKIMSENGGIGSTAFWKHISEDLFPTEEHLDKFIGPMEEIVFIGYPSGLWDTKNMLPIARKGMTATACYVDFDGEKKFLIDASVFPGSSGSPVFIYYAGSHPDKRGGFYSGNRMHFIGLIAKVFQRLEEGEVKAVDIPTEENQIAQVYQMIDLGITFRPETIIEAIDYYLACVGNSPISTPKSPSRNSLCQCGSGKKYKHCHGLIE